MIAIGDVLISDEVLNSYFRCELSACKGACCIEGDYGAPLTDEESEILSSIQDIVKEFISPESFAKLQNSGTSMYHKEARAKVTQLMPDGACVFMGRDPMGIAYCSIEKAYEKGLTNFKKPISCHLYPIRVTENKELGFTAVNYHRWEICGAACRAGEKDKLPLYLFLKEPIVRKFGPDFYEELVAAAQYLKNT
ncbi:MAG: DUF3109 family protein [Saprospiraceae bacterium]|nr:DUF3109 family protein [Saprospiraceae bacterium]